jgi:hypothetical protein
LPSISSHSRDTWLFEMPDMTVIAVSANGVASNFEERLS